MPAHKKPLKLADVARATVSHQLVGLFSSKQVERPLVDVIIKLHKYQEQGEEAGEITETLTGLGLLEDLIWDVLDELNAQGEDKGSVKGTFLTPLLPPFFTGSGPELFF